ncbi:MAG TPA: phosphoribosyltransferase [Sulfurimonas autotrophica]|nr:phosphoribosyltransferase [Sulfurimonas autotrophica]
MKHYYSYENFQKDTRELIQRVQSVKAGAIVAIARGGLTLAHCMAEGLAIRDLQSIRTELYDGEHKREGLSLFGACDLSHVKSVLVVDDIADSGETLQYVMEYLQKKFPDVVFTSCTLFYKKSSCFEPNFWVNEADAWIEFFWEKDFVSP